MIERDNGRYGIEERNMGTQTCYTESDAEKGSRKIRQSCQSSGREFWLFVLPPEKFSLLLSNGGFTSSRKRLGEISKQICTVPVRQSDKALDAVKCFGGSNRILASKLGVSVSTTSTSTL